VLSQLSPGALQKIQFIDVSPFSMNIFADVFKANLSEGATAKLHKPSGGKDHWEVISKTAQNDKEPSTSKKGEGGDAENASDVCAVCLCELYPNDTDTPSDDEIVRLNICSHIFHEECIKLAFESKKQCPLCLTWYDTLIGSQPIGSKMRVSKLTGQTVPGHPDADGFHVINYDIPSGIQTEGHLRPGTPFHGTRRTAYLPNTTEGTEVLRLLELAFERRLIFTVGDSITSGQQNVAVWNNIHHKTSPHGGPQSYGYPDPDYLDRVREELAAVGVRKEMLDK
jgi:deltex-like protein